MRSTLYVAPVLLKCVTTNSVSSVAEYVATGALQKWVLDASVNSVPVPVPARA